MSSSKKIKAISPLLILTLQTIYFLSFARLDPEPHHDGVMLAAAIGVSEGKIPNKDVFTQYGPVTPLFQGLWLSFTEPSLLSLRIFTALLLALCGLVLFLILKSITTLYLASLVSISWAVSYPFFILPMNLPWASIIATLFVLISILILISPRVGLQNNFGIILVTTILVFGIFVRIHMVIPVIVLGIYYLHYWLRHKTSKLFFLWLTATFVTLGFCIGALYYLGALKSYVDQTILWPISYYAAPAIGFTKGEIVARALLLFFPGFLFLLYLLYKLSILKIETKFKLLFFFALILTVVALSNVDVPHKSYLNPLYVAVSLSQNFPSTISYAAVTLLLFYFWKERKKLAFLDLRLLPVALGASLIPQLYPAHDTLHLYWIAPGVIAAVVIYNSVRASESLTIRLNQLTPVLSSIVVICLILGGMHLREDRVAYSDPVVRGMIGIKSTVQPIDEMLIAIDQLPKDATIKFDCAHGLFAVAGGRYLASDELFVNWGVTKSEDQYAYNLVCDLNEEGAQMVRQKSRIIKEVKLETGQILILFSNLG
jgi:hypothetical protein